MLTALAILLLAVVPRDDVARESCDLIELNSFHDENGREIFKQVIFWDWDEQAARYQVRTYRLVKHESQLPNPSCCGRQEWRALWLDGDVNRLIVAPAFRETWTQCFDPELHERTILPVEKRRGLSEPRKKDSPSRPTPRAARLAG